jgi:CheY-like chemotaxis protein
MKKSSPPSQGAEQNQKKRILLMDDEEIVRAAAGAMLDYLGYEVEFARDGGEAIEGFRRAHQEGTPFDLVILDLSVPGGIGGTEVLTRMREIDPRIKAIVSSGYSEDPAMADFRKFGFDAVFPKPYSLKNFAAILKKLDL